MNFRHSFVGNVLDGCRGRQGEDARRFCIRFELPQWNPWRFWMRFGLPRRTTGGFSFVLDWLAKSLAEVRVFSKWLAENGALNDCFPPFFVREIAIHLRLYVKPPFIGEADLRPQEEPIACTTCRSAAGGLTSVDVH